MKASLISFVPARPAGLQQIDPPQPLSVTVELQAIPLVELINTAAGVNEFLLSSVVRMAFGADFYRDILPR